MNVSSGNRTPQTAPLILIVDDEEVNRFILESNLRSNGFRTITAGTGEECLDAASSHKPDIILLDIVMPGMDGFSTCERLKSQQETTEIPVIFLSALTDVEQKTRGFESGGVDYVSKPFDPRELLARVRLHLTLRAQEIQLRQYSEGLEKMVLERTAQLREANEKMTHNLFHDPLTKLPNRAALSEKLEKETQRLHDDPHYKFALLLFNLDRFSRLNESFGYELGDELISSLAERLNENRKPHETLLHLGGDEFALLLTELDNLDEPLVLAGNILDIMKQPCRFEGHELQITASGGVVLSDARYDKGVDILRDATTAVNQAKIKGRDRFQVFNPAMHQKTRQAMQTFIDLRQALERQECDVFYQPVICLQWEKAVGVEALARWRHPTRGMIPPGEFIPIAEETGLILPLGRWILEKACTDMHAFASQQGMTDGLMLSVNLSAKQFAQHDLFEQIESILKRTGFPPKLLKLEITESVVMENAEAAVRILEKLRRLDVLISIDDFGTGYSSLSYLHRFSPDILKVDRSFISRMHMGGEHLEIVRTIVTLGHILNMQIIAEGAETREEVAMLTALGCEYVQGFYFAKPMPLDELHRCSLFLRPGADGAHFNHRACRAPRTTLQDHTKRIQTKRWQV